MFWPGAKQQRIGLAPLRARALSRRDLGTRRIYILGDQIFTSAGVTTGIDMALSIIRRDCGPAAALAVGRELVVQMQRSGGQQQFSVALTAQQDAEPSCHASLISLPLI